jgi:hypothetical protein
MQELVKAMESRRKKQASDSSGVECQLAGNGQVCA